MARPFGLMLGGEAAGIGFSKVESVPGGDEACCFGIWRLILD